jgi:formamidopyrimidine-DNA glycosylase
MTVDSVKDLIPKGKKLKNAVGSLNEYKRAKRIRIYLSHLHDGVEKIIEFTSIIRTAHKHAKYIVMKLPLNYDTLHMFEKIEGMFKIVAQKKYGAPSRMMIYYLKRIEI